MHVLMGKNPQGIFPRRDFPHGDFFFCRVFILRGVYSKAKYFSAFIHIYIVYGMDPAQLLHVVVMKASIYLVTNSKTDFHIMLPIYLYLQ